MVDLKAIADQYDIDLEQLQVEKGEVSLEVLQAYIVEHFYPRIQKEEKLLGFRKVIAERLSESYRNAVHVTINMDIDPTNLLVLKEKTQGNPSLTVIMLKLVAFALKDCPNLNATLEDNVIKLYDSVNICVAVDAPYGLVTPVIRDVDKKSVADLVTEYEDVVSRARAGQLKEKDFVGGTFTITNLGMLGVDSFTPVINPPQVAILGINRIKDVVVLENNEPRLAKSMTLSLSVDHRVVDGAPGARFLQKVKEYFENASALE